MQPCAIDDFKPDEARSEAEKLRGGIGHGKDPQAEKRVAHAASLTLFLEKEYGHWVRANRPTGAETLRRLDAAFPNFLPLPLKDITLARVERRRTKRLEAGVTASTVNRNLAALRSVLTQARKWEVLGGDHPFDKLETARVDEKRIVRHLDPAEEKRLRGALEDRDTKRRVARESANEWRKAREYEPLPALGRYADHVTPLVLLDNSAIFRACGSESRRVSPHKWNPSQLQSQATALRGFAAKRLSVPGLHHGCPAPSGMSRLWRQHMAVVRWDPLRDIENLSYCDGLLRCHRGDEALVHSIDRAPTGNWGRRSWP